MYRQPPETTRSDPLCPYSTLFRSLAGDLSVRASPPPASAAGGAASDWRSLMDWATLAGYWPFMLGLMVTGVVSGVAAGLLGVGGGAIIVPALSNALRSEEHTSELQSLMRISYAVFCLIKTKM